MGARLWEVRGGEREGDISGVDGGGSDENGEKVELYGIYD